MRRGCMSVGDVTCDHCGRLVRHPEQYLVMDEEDLQPGDDLLDKLRTEQPERYASIKARRGHPRLCLECAMEKGYARYRADKGEKVVTFFEK